MARDLKYTRNIGIAAHIDAGKLLQQNAFYITQVFLIKLEKYMMELQPWTGWNKSRKEV